MSRTLFLAGLKMRASNQSRTASVPLTSATTTAAREVANPPAHGDEDECNSQAATPTSTIPDGDRDTGANPPTAAVACERRTASSSDATRQRMATQARCIPPALRRSASAREVMEGTSYYVGLLRHEPAALRILMNDREPGTTSHADDGSIGDAE